MLNKYFPRVSGTCFQNCEYANQPKKVGISGIRVENGQETDLEIKTTMLYVVDILIKGGCNASNPKIVSVTAFIYKT